MQMVMSETLRTQRASLRLVCECESCEHFVPGDLKPAARAGAPVDEDGGVCDLLYPTAPHRKAAFDAAADGDPVWFCKMFEVK